MPRNPSKLKKILLIRRMSQVELITLIKSKYPLVKINSSTINKIVQSRNLNYTITTALLIADSLNVELQEIVDKEEILEKLAKAL